MILCVSYFVNLFWDFGFSLNFACYFMQFCNYLGFQ
jgi:hypothetical protein